MFKVKKLNEDALLPKASHPGKALAWDIYGIEERYINPGQQVTIKTGIAVQVEQINAGFLLRERSSMAKKGIKLLGGVIDADYKGEWLVMLINLGDTDYHIQKGDRIAQAIMLPTLTALLPEWIDEFPESVEGDRGTAGFGSSGR